MKSILVVDDHAVVRQGLIRILSESPSPFRIDEAGSSREALDKAGQNAYDAVILDVTLPDESGIETLKVLKRLHPTLPVLILSVHPEEQYAVRALRDGAAGYLTKDSAPEELLRALGLAFQSRRYVSAALAERLAATLGEEASRFPHESLSDREFQVLRLIGNGKTIKEIAAALFLSPKTVSTYRTRILQKMGLTTTAELVRYSVRNALID